MSNDDRNDFEQFLILIKACLKNIYFIRRNIFYKFLKKTFIFIINQEECLFYCVRNNIFMNFRKKL